MPDIMTAERLAEIENALQHHASRPSDIRDLCATVRKLERELAEERARVGPAMNRFVAEVHRRSREDGWWATPELSNIGTKLCLIHSEISEALEGFRKDLMDDHLPKRKMIEVELADAMIRIGDLAGALALDLGGAIEEKMEYNIHREDHKIEAREKSNGKHF